MTKHLRFLFVMLLAMIWSAGWAAQKTETITIADYVPSSGSKAITAEEPLSQNGFKIYIEKQSTNTPGLYKRGKNLRFYEKDILHIESSNGDMTSVEFTVTSVTDFSIKGMSSNTWSGTPSASLSFTGSDTNKITVIKITYTDSSSSAKTDTKVSFDENSGKTFTFTEGKCSDGTFTTPTATETTGVAGTIAYSSNNATAISVDASTGELTFKGYGKAIITATFTPNDTEKYAESTDSYIVENNQKVDESVILFSADAKSFESIKGNVSYDTNKGNFDFVATNGKKYTFNVQKALKDKGRLQLKSSTVTSPSFPDFTNGYKVTIEYETTKATITLSSGSKSVKGSSKDKTILLDVQDGSAFKINITSNVLYISKIEIVPNKVGITLDEKSESNTIEAKNGVNVTLKRTMVANEWNTICLPFDVSAEQATAAFGDNVKIAALDKNSTGTTLSFNSVKAITASVPYLIKPSIASPADGYNFKGVTIKDDGKGNVVTPEPVMTEDLFGLVGIYNKVDVNEAIKNTLFSGDCYAAFLGAGDKIYKAGTGMTKGFRAYFAIPNDAAASALRVVIDGTATSIKNIDSEVVESNAPVYNLQGQRVNGNNLTPGIYVKAGKKFVVK